MCMYNVYVYLASRVQCFSTSLEIQMRVHAINNNYKTKNKHQKAYDIKNDSIFRR